MSPEGQTDLVFELSQIRKELAVLNRMLGRGRNLGQDEVRVRAAASSLQSIYNGMERMLQTVLKEKGGRVSEGPSSHSDLLDAASALGVLSSGLVDSLRELMGFRHFYRHSYGFMIDHEQLNPLLRGVEKVVDQFARELHLPAGGA